MTQIKKILEEKKSELLEGWREVCLGEVVEIIMGQSPKGESYNQIGDGLPFYQGVTEFNDKFVSKKTYTNQPTKIVEENTILFSVRAPVGRVNFVNWKSCIGRGNAGMNMKNGNQDFLFFLLKFLEKNLQNYTSGTVFSSISGAELKKIPVLIPENIETQKSIAKILSSFDEKIELLREQNETLEKIGQEVFKEWFGKYKVGGELPEGWRVGKIGKKNFSEIIGSGIDKFDGEKIYLATADVSENTITNTSTKITFNEKPSRANMQPIEKSIWFAKMQDSRKILMFDDFSRNQIKNYILSTGFAGIKTTEESHYYLWCFVLSEKFDDMKNNLANGAVQVALNNTNLQKMEIIIPSKNILEKFNNLAKPLFEKIQKNNSQIQELGKTRDELLPRLMRGEVLVEE